MKQHDDDKWNEMTACGEKKDLNIFKVPFAAGFAFFFAPFLSAMKFK